MCLHVCLLVPYNTHSFTTSAFLELKSNERRAEFRSREVFKVLQKSRMAVYMSGRQEAGNSTKALGRERELKQVK